MAYATREDLTVRYGSLTISEIESSKRSEGNPPEAVTLEALKTASGIIDGYVGSRYVLPLPPDNQLEAICCQIAIYLLYTREPPEDIEKKYKNAISWLKDVQKKITNLTFATSLDAIQKENLEHNEPVVMSARSAGSVFSDDILNKMPGINPR